MTQSPRSSAPSEPATPTAARFLSERYRPLRTLWPNLATVSAKQAAFLVLDDTLEAFFGGAAGPGKSDALLAGALQYIDVPGYAAIIFRRTFTDLAIPGAAMSRAQAWLHGKAHWNDQRKTWTFPSGATLSFGYLDHDNDVFRYQSSEFQYIGFDELTQFSEYQYQYLFSRLRTTSAVNVPLRMRSASNPGGIGHGWVKRRFMEERPPGVVFIPANLEDHPDDQFKTTYRESLAKLDPLTRRRLERGDWDAAEGLAFTIDRDTHLIPDIEIPDGWERFESMDFGVANPTCVLAWATDYDGNLIVFDSYYQGNTLTSDHAAAIEAKRETWWPTGSNPVCYADPSMWARKGHVNRWGDPATDVTELQEHGVSGLEQANNHRRPGRIRLLELLKPVEGRKFPAYHPRAGEPGSPGLFIVADRCPELVRQLQDAPLLKIDSSREGAGEIVDPDWESHHGHAVAAARYGAMSRPDPSVEPPVEPDDERERMARRMLDRVSRNTGLMPV